MCILADLGTNFAVGKNEFGTCAGSHMQALNRSSIEFIDSYTINGNASAGYHWYADELSQYIFNTITVTLSGTPVFAGFCAVLHQSVIGSAAVVTFSGSASAGTPKYFVYSLGLLDTGGVTFPGGTAGTNAGAGAVVI
jgi:hypothetical protein